MVAQAEMNGETVYRCEACGLHYRNRELAEECEEHCRQRNSCSIEIIQQAIERTG